MMKVLSSHIIEQLVQIERQIHYNEPPPDEVLPFVVINRDSPILLSAPHGCRTFRNRNGETWHEEDEYTAGMALLLGDFSQVSVIATIWQTNDSDPNDTKETDTREKRSSPYKMELRKLCDHGVRWVIDLHGASQKSDPMASSQLVDLGTGRDGISISEEYLRILRAYIENYLGAGSTDRQGKKGWPASAEGRSITAFAYGVLKISAVQIEMKPAVRVARRRLDATMYGKPLSEGGGPYAAPAKHVLEMMQSLADFIEYLKSTE